MKKCNLSYNKKSVEQWYIMDKEQISKGDYAVREDRKKQRKIKKRSRVVQHDAFQKSEAVHYQRQGFHINSEI